MDFFDFVRENAEISTQLKLKLIIFVFKVFAYDKDIYIITNNHISLTSIKMSFSDEKQLYTYLINNSGKKRKSYCFLMLNKINKIFNEIIFSIEINFVPKAFISYKLPKDKLLFFRKMPMQNFS